MMKSTSNCEKLVKSSSGPGVAEFGEEGAINFIFPPCEDVYEIFLKLRRC